MLGFKFVYKPFDEEHHVAERLTIYCFDKVVSVIYCNEATELKKLLESKNIEVGVEQ